MDYLPFGEQEAGGSGTSHKFTGYERDSESGNDYAVFRHYGSTHVSFLQPDPYNFGANVTNPQTWNGYAYVLNSPLVYVDPQGLKCIYDQNGNAVGDDGKGGGCAAVGVNPDGSEVPQQVFVYGSVGTNEIASDWEQAVAYLTRVPWSLTVFKAFEVDPLIPIGPGLSLTVSYIPSSHTLCIGPGVGSGTMGKSFNVGPLVAGSPGGLSNPRAVLSGFSLNGGLQPSTFSGVQATVNKSGLLAGPTFGSVGASVTASYSKFF